MAAVGLDKKALIRRLLKAGIEHVIIGGVALNFHHSDRLTHDLDFAVKAVDQDKVITLLYALGYRHPQRVVDRPDGAQEVTWAKTALDARAVATSLKLGALNFYLLDTHGEIVDQVDFVFDNPVPFSRLKAKAGRIGEHPPIAVACLEHLKIMKEKRIAEQQHAATDVQDLAFITRLLTGKTPPSRRVSRPR